MATEIQLAFLIFGSFAGTLALTLFPFFRTRKSYEERVDVINTKPVADRTEEEKALLANPPGSFFATYKYRFLFGLIIGFGVAFAAIEGKIAEITENTTNLAVFISGMTASGFFTALANAIRETE